MSDTARSFFGYPKPSTLGAGWKDDQQPGETRLDYLTRCFRVGYYRRNLMSPAELDAVVQRIHREKCDE